MRIKQFPIPPIDSWLWDFGDGTTSTLQNPTHTYTTYGSYDVSLTVTDLDGCSKTLTKQAFVDTSDTIAPTAVCKPFTAALNANGMVTISATAVDGGSTDNCELASLTVTPNTFTCANVGENTVTLTVTDGAGNTATCTTIITINDNEPPTINCPTDFIVSNDTGECSSVVNFEIPTATDNCSAITTTFSYTGSVQEFIVPDGVTEIDAQVWGAQGGANWVNNVNYGGYVRATIPVTPGDILHIYVGEQPATITGGWNGGGNGENNGIGGGGSSDIRINGNALTDRIIVAGAGGGAGFWSGQHIFGGLGGGLVGGAGYRGDSTNPGGDPGTQTSSGDGSCVSFNNPIVTGGFGYGGAPNNCGCEGYGGGSGYYGGAGSGNCRGGGGGSSYTDPTLTNVIHSQGVRSGHGEITITWNTTTTTTQIAGLPSGSKFPVGTTTNTFKTTDSSGNTAFCSFNVTVNDTEAPIALTKDITVQLDENGTASISAEDVDNGSYDACGIKLLSLFPTNLSFDCSNIGENEVKLLVVDNSDNVTAAYATVTVVDTTAPTVNTKNITVQLDANGTASITMEDINNGSSDNCEIETLVLDTTSFDCTNVGDNTVTLTVTDVNGNTANGIAIVTVEDNIAPIVSTQNITVQLDANGTASITVEDINNGSSDNCGIESIVLDTTTFDCTAVGENTVTLIVTDVNGNTANGIAIVTVEDNIAPTVSTQNITVQLDANGTASITVEDINNGSSDNCGIESIVLDTTAFNCTAVGDNTVTLTVTDVNGNTANGIAIVTVEDNIAPIASCSTPFTIQLDETGSATITADDIKNGSSDNCEIESLTIDTTTFDCSNIGDNNVTLTVTDAYGNSSSVTTEVTINDVTAPIVITQNISVELDETGNATISAEDIDDGSFDACGIATLSLDQTTFSCPTLGDTTVTLTVVDNNGNSASEIAIVTFTSDDLDNDGIADVCDDDLDGDGVDNDIDNCPTVSNPNQADIDRNGIGDVCDQGELEIPKGFSPNGDGVNDEFIIAGLHKYPNNSIQIYNRYGNMVYESKNYQNYWDGVSSGKTRKLPAAPYFYVLSINGSTQIVKGWLYINY